MAKEKQEKRMIPADKIVAVLSKKLNKRGEIKGDGKSDTKHLKIQCTHHHVNKKGKIKPAIYNDGEGHILCEMCDRSVTTDLKDKSEVKKIVKPIFELSDQLAYIGQAADLGNNVISYATSMKLMLNKFTKFYGKSVKAVKKAEKVKKHKKGKNRRNNNSGGGNLSGWSNAKFRG